MVSPFKNRTLIICAQKVKVKVREEASTNLVMKLMTVNKKIPQKLNLSEKF